MKVILRVDITGTRNGEEWPRRGEVVDLPTEGSAPSLRERPLEQGLGHVRHLRGQSGSGPRS